MSMEEHNDGIKTVECLRARLLAERLASKAAQADADRLAGTLADLEKLLQEEVRQRERAEKRLRLLSKKLKSLEVFDFYGELNPPDTSAGGRFSKCNKLGRCGCPRESLPRDEGRGSGSPSCGSSHQLVSLDGSWSLLGVSTSQNMEALQEDAKNNGPGSEEFLDAAPRRSSASSSKGAVEVLVSLRDIRKRLQSLVENKVAE